MGKLLYALDSESCLDVAELVLETLFKSIPKEQLLTNLDSLDDK